jgi:hypothetical protein
MNTLSKNNENAIFDTYTEAETTINIYPLTNPSRVAYETTMNPNVKTIISKITPADERQTL